MKLTLAISCQGLNLLVRGDPPSCSPSERTPARDRQLKSTSAMSPTAIIAFAWSLIKRRLGARILDVPARYLFGHDVFIAYGRPEGIGYAGALASALRDGGLECKVDLWGTQADEELPDELKVAARRSTLMVVVATPNACRSPFVGEEIGSFLSRGRHIIPIQLNSDLESAVWWERIKGVPRPVEVTAATEDDALAVPDKPSEKVVGLILDAYRYRTA